MTTPRDREEGDSLYDFCRAGAATGTAILAVKIGLDVWDGVLWGIQLVKTVFTYGGLFLLTALVAAVLADLLRLPIEGVFGGDFAGFRWSAVPSLVP